MNTSGLVLMRHGQAEGYAVSDASRRLTPVGEEDVRRAGEFLAGLSLDITRVLHSPYRRAQRTAELMCEALAQPPMVVLSCLTPAGDLNAVVRELDPFDGQVVLCVSHQPLVGNLLNWLVDGCEGGGYPFVTAAMALLRQEFTGPGGAGLEWYRTPQELA